MPRRPALFRIVIVALLLLALTVPLAQAAGPAAHRPHPAAASFSLTDLLGRGWGGFVRFWLDNGCGLDPSGRCVAAPRADNGCGLDPDGHCRAGS
jgi:hypothetical protein